MNIEEIEAYVRSRVGAVFSSEHAEKIISMIHDWIQDEKTDKELAETD